MFFDNPRPPEKRSIPTLFLPQKKEISQETIAAILKKERSLRQEWLKNKILGLMKFLGVVALWAAIFYGYHAGKEFLNNSDLLKVKKIEWDIVAPLTTERIAKVSGLQEGINILSLDLPGIEEKILEIVQVARAEVNFSGLNEIRVTVRPKIPKLLLLNHGKFLQIDHQGQIIGTAKSALNQNLPIINGMEIDSANEGELIRSRSFGKVFQWIQSLPSDILANISDFNFEGDSQFFLYTIDGFMVYPALNGSFLARFPLLKELISHFKIRNEAVKYIDMRFGDDFIVKIL